MNFDIVVVGSGIAGLSFALKCAKLGHKVCVSTKKSSNDTNTNHAQGGIASVTDSTDNFESHISDTLIAGDGLCDEATVRKIIEAGPAQTRALIEAGVKFTNLKNGALSLGKEGGHSARRILHVKDFTGRAIEEALLAQISANKNITLLEHHFAIDLIKESKVKKIANAASDKIIGIYILDCAKQKVMAVKAKIVMLSTGGSGQVYLYTTNPSIATGDGIAIAYRAGATVSNLEFIQFHPTALYSEKGERFLISEAVRGEGAILKNIKGEAFMLKYDSRADLAPRDIVARAIDQEMKKLGSAHVWLDITHIEKSVLKNRFPQIFEHCKSMGIDISKDYIPVVPAAHYQCGGVLTKVDAITNIMGLYACGEVACTGLHGANRLASNSLLEAVVVAENASKNADKYIKNFSVEKIKLPMWVDGDMLDSDEGVILLHNADELKRAMWDYVGIVRSRKRLERAERRIKNLSTEINEYYWNFKVESRLLELRNMIQVAQLIIESAKKRKESRGLHFTLDYPQKSNKAINTKIRKK